MISPPILKLARFNTPDCLSALVTLLSLYLLLEVGADLPGYILLLASVYVRTDNAVLVLLVVAYLSLAAKRLEKSKAAVLALLAVASVGIINHFSGDYGLKMLYYRSFIAVPLAPGELVAQFSIGDYLHAFRSGLSGLANGYMLLYLLLGAVGLAARPPRELLELALLTLLYTAFHFLLFPSSQERFMGPVYIGLGILGATAVSSIAATSRTAKAAAA